MNELDHLLALPEAEKAERGLLHTPREISQQPDSWRRTYRLLEENLHRVRDFLSRVGVAGRMNIPPTVFLIGAGSSDYVGRSLVALMQSKWQCEVRAVPSTDLLTGMDDFVLSDRQYLWISFSRSGDSSEGVAVLEAALARHPEIHHLIITCNGGGRMADEFSGRANVLCLTLDDEVNDRGLAMTSSFSNMVVAGHCLAHFEDLAGYEPTLGQMVVTGQQFLGAAAGAAALLAEEGFTRLCFLGTGPLRAAAVESALKVLELTAGGISTFSESYLGLRHGPLSAIDHETLVIGFLSGDARRRSYETDLLREISDKGFAGKLFAVSPSAECEADFTDQRISIGFPHPVPDFYRPPVDVIFGQLLGLFSSLRQGLKPDTPSPNGAISRVVEQVKVY
ncbi:MAG TPA: SIS domain-containing protein [Blastocatellia bacterium]|nr:SIS domain-containing protein [Blastocatellia bacterium]